MSQANKVSWDTTMTGKPGIIAPLLFLIGLAFVIFSGCTVPAGNSTEGRLVVAVTLPPQAEMVREIGGDRVEVLVLVPPGSDPHTFEPLPREVEEASRARLYLTAGTGILPVEDLLAARLLAMNPDLVVADSSVGVELIGSDGKDPHVWLSLKNAEKMEENIRDALIAVDPEGAPRYSENGDAYRDRILALDRKVAGMFSGKEGGVIIVSHEAWAYFARDYDLRIVSIEKEGKEPTAGDLESLIELARAHHVRVVFADALENPREAEAIAREVGAEVEVINPLAPDYLANMERVATAFAGSLSP
jgi:zinc transport system substrate-binding protein